MPVPRNFARAWTVPPALREIAAGPATRAKSGGVKVSSSSSATDGKASSITATPRKRIVLQTAFIVQTEKSKRQTCGVTWSATPNYKPEGRIGKVDSLTRIVSFCESITRRSKSRSKIVPRDAFRKKDPGVVSLWVQEATSAGPNATHRRPSIASPMLAAGSLRGTGCFARPRKPRLPQGDALAAPRKWHKSGQ